MIQKRYITYIHTCEDSKAVTLPTRKLAQHALLEFSWAEVKKVVQPVNLVDRNYLPNLGLTENIC